jgi:hypothetical protein
MSRNATTTEVTAADPTVPLPLPTVHAWLGNRGWVFTVTA